MISGYETICRLCRRAQAATVRTESEPTLILWVHDVKLLRNGDAFYSTGAVTAGVMARYLKAFGSLTVASRTRSLDRDAQYFSPLDTTGIEFAPLSRDWQGVRKLKRLVSDSDGVIARVPSLFGNLAGTLAIRADRPLYVEVVGSAWDAFRLHSKVGLAMAPIMELSTRHVVQRANSAIYVTEEFLQRRYPCAGDSVACSDVEVEPDSNDLDARLVMCDDPHRPLTIGTLAAVDVPYKGQADVIGALPELVERGLVDHYLVAGPGDPTRLTRLATKLNVREHVRLLGPIPSAKVPQFMRQLDVYVQPSATEGMPRALLEAMSVGCPAIGTRVGGIPEVLPKERMYEYSDVDQLIALISELAGQDLRLDSIANFARAHAFNSACLGERRAQSLDRFARYVAENAS